MLGTGDGEVMAPHDTTRRSLLAAGAGAAIAASWAGSAAAAAPPIRPLPGGGLDRELRALERRSGRTIGVVVGDGRRPVYGYRSREAFPMCSTFKTLLVAALLRDRAYDDAFWAQPVSYAASEVVENSPVTGADADRVMTRWQLADAALRRSDNTAGNLLLRDVGGPRGITRFARSLGAHDTRLDRWEPDLNEAVPGDLRDTSTARDLHHLFAAVLVGDALDQLGRARLLGWMLRNTTAGERLGKGLEPDVELADKTGAGAYGVVNDVGVYFREERRVSVAVLTRTSDPAAAPDNVVAAVGRLVRERWLR
jgi:beta-lactamase class A